MNLDSPIRKLDQPNLFGLNHSNRDFRKPAEWGKNKFTSSFPAALACYMFARNIRPVYMILNSQGQLVKSSISVDQVFKIDPLGDDSFYAFETEYSPYRQLVTGKVPRIDLVMMRRSDSLNLTGLEMKLTALPDNSTHHLPENKYGCEIVVRPDTIVYLALSIALVFKEDRTALYALLQDDALKITNWRDTEELLPLIPRMAAVLNRVMIQHATRQEPLILQPIWKTEGKAMRLHQNAFDMFVWSNFAFTKIFFYVAESDAKARRMSRQARSIVWLMKMLLDFAVEGQIDSRITNEVSHGSRTDKAFSVPGRITHDFMASPELFAPRIKRDEVKQIILGGGQTLLSPERRLDAVLVNMPELFS